MGPNEGTLGIVFDFVILMEKKVHLIIMILFVFFCACKKRTVITFPEIIMSEYDTLIQFDLKEMERSIPLIYAINVIANDTIRLSNEVEYEEENYADYDHMEIDRTDSLKIIVNPISSFHSNLYGLTSVLPPLPMKIDEKEVDYDKRSHDFYSEMKRIHYEMTPVFIFNLSNKNQALEKPIGGSLQLITEAKDEEGNWKPVDFSEQFRPLCRTGHQNYNLQSNRFIVAGVAKYQGDFKTQLRVKLKSFSKVFYSNSFEGNINKNQFNTAQVVADTEKRFSLGKMETRENKLKELFLE